LLRALINHAHSLQNSIQKGTPCLFVATIIASDNRSCQCGNHMIRRFKTFCCQRPKRGFNKIAALLQIMDGVPVVPAPEKEVFDAMMAFRRRMIY